MRLGDEERDAVVHPGLVVGEPAFADAAALGVPGAVGAEEQPVLEAFAAKLERFEQVGEVAAHGNRLASLQSAQGGDDRLAAGQVRTGRLGHRLGQPCCVEIFEGAGERLVRVELRVDHDREQSARPYHSAAFA